MSLVAEPTDELQSARRRAIEESGWGRDFHLFQPHQLAFWVLLAGWVLGAFEVWQEVSATAPVYGRAYEAGFALSGLYTVGFWLFLRSIDRYERLSPRLLTCGFLWGGLAAAFAIAIHGNGALSSLYGKWFGQPFVNDWGPALSAPFTEELSKGVGVLLLLTLAPQIIRSPRAALFAGAFVGLGFQVFEDVLYGSLGAAADFNGDPVGAVVQSAALRFISGIFSHAAYTAIFAVGVLFLVGSPVVRRNAARGIGFMALAMLLHGVWDGAGAFGDNGVLVLLPLVAVSVLTAVGLWLGFHVSAGYEQRWAQAVLAPEVAAGTVTDEEARAFGGTRRDRRAFRRGGPRRARRHVLEAVGDLTHELAAADGTSTPAVKRARAELGRLRAAAH